MSIRMTWPDYPFVTSTVTSRKAPGLNCDSQCENDGGICRHPHHGVMAPASLAEISCQRIFTPTINERSRAAFPDPQQVTRSSRRRSAQR